MTVIVLKSVPNSLRGDLTRWMQEVATGVYVGNFNTRIREYLWRRVQETLGSGEASMCFATRNEIGYDFATENGLRSVIDFDGIPLVFIPKKEGKSKTLTEGFSNAAKYHRANISSYSHAKGKLESYVVIDIETDGLNPQTNHILEIGALLYENGKESYFNELIITEQIIPSHITKINGITNKLLIEKGREEVEVLKAFREFIGNYDLVGYNISFDISFLQEAFKRYDLGNLSNQLHDLLRIVKKEQLFQANYKLETSLKSYGIYEKIPHRALGDVKLIKMLADKLNKF